MVYWLTSLHTHTVLSHDFHPSSWLSSLLCSSQWALIVPLFSACVRRNRSPLHRNRVHAHHAHDDDDVHAHKNTLVHVWYG